MRFSRGGRSLFDLALIAGLFVGYGAFLAVTLSGYHR